MRNWKVGLVLSLAGMTWAGGLSLGIYRLSRYEGTPGALRSAAAWPADAPERNRDGYTLAVFLHPECPCSQASVSSLDRIIAHAGKNLRVYVFAVLPEGAPAEWNQSPLIARAREIHGVQVVEDKHGRLSRQFAALTSGQAVLFDAAGQRVFSGGITQGRGHEGPSAGSQSIESIVRGRQPGLSETPVFGCSLFGGCPVAAASSEDQCQRPH